MVLVNKLPILQAFQNETTVNNLLKIFWARYVRVKKILCKAYASFI